MTSSCSSRVVQVKDDPDGFKLIDNKTILFTIACWPAFWYRVENAPPPVAIITDYLDTTVLGKPMLKPQTDLLKRYKYQEIAPKGTKGLGVNAATKFWTATY